MYKKIFSGLMLAALGLSVQTAAQAADEVITVGGLTVKGASKELSFSIGGRVQWDFAAFDNDTADNVSGSEFRRIRIALKGSAYGWGYKIQPDFADDAVTMKDVYITRKLGAPGTLYLGQFKQPFGMDELTSSNEITIQERASATSIAASHQMGVGLFGNQGMFSWGVSAYNLDDNDGDTTNGTGFGGRLTAAPINSRDNTLHFGLAVAQESYGNSSNGDNERFRLRTRPAGHLSDASRTALIDINNGQRTDVTKLGVEAAGVMGPFSLQAEYATAEADDASEEGTVNSYYLAGSFVITGERRSYKDKNGVFGGVKPNGPNGAWELVARMDFAEGDQNPLGGATSADVEVDSLTLGVTWYANPNTRVMLSYWDAEITGQQNGTVVDDRPSAITGRVQFNF